MSKYVVLKVSDYLDQRQVLNKVSNIIGTANGHFIDDALSALDAARIDDAVVIRRQDIFAGPALHTYAAMIAIAIKLAAPGETRDALRKIADYFHEQAILADEEGKRVPT